MKLNMLVPFPTLPENPTLSKVISNPDEVKKPTEMAKARLIRKSAFWPITISSSLLIPMALVSIIKA